MRQAALLVVGDGVGGERAGPGRVRAWHRRKRSLSALRICPWSEWTHLPSFFFEKDPGLY